MRMLYKYPQGAFPYADLVAENGRRKGRKLPEYELINTGIFAENRYFDVSVEYAKAAPDGILMRVTIVNRGAAAAPLTVLPQLWSRNTWSWREGAPRPLLRSADEATVEATRADRPTLQFQPLQPAEFLFCENETNGQRLFDWGEAHHPKDAINDDVVAGRRDRVNPLKEGTKCAALSRHVIAGGASLVLRYRWAPDRTTLEAASFDRIVAERLAEADDFYAVLQRSIGDPDARLVQRQALA